MTFILKLTKKSDMYGVVASGLCLVHCLLTPILFTFQTSIFMVGKRHFFWSTLDLVFLFISFLAILASASNTSKPWMKYALWISWTLLVSIIINEKLHITEIAEELIYLPSIALVILHLYNRNYCQCTDRNCCASTANELLK